MNENPDRFATVGVELDRDRRRSANKPACFNWSKTMNIFYIIGVVVVIIAVAGFLGLHL